MTREEFIEELDKRRYSYEIEGDKLVVTHSNDVNLRSLETLPSDVEFKNERDVWLESLETLPPGVEFKNGGDVDLSSLVGGWFEDWKGNIKGINYKRLLNVMISKGIFEK